MAKIKETKLSVTDPLVTRLFADGNYSRYNFMRVVYIDEPVPKIVCSELSSEGESEHSKINEWCDRPLTYYQCVVLATFYYQVTPDTLHSLLNTKKHTTDRTIEFILKHTNGLLLFSYQFELVAQYVFNVPYQIAVDIRKAFNKHRDFLHGFCLPKEEVEDFERIIENHMITKKVAHPFLNGASNLFDYVSSDRRDNF